MTERPTEYEPTEQEARQTLKILQEIRDEQEADFRSKPHTPEALEYHLIGIEQDFVNVIKLEAKKNHNVWDLYQQQKTEMVDLDQFARKQAEKKYPTMKDQGMLQMKAKSTMVKAHTEQVIKPANDDQY